MDYKLKYMGSIMTLDKICYPYSLQSVDDLVVHRTKSACEIISLSNFDNYNVQSKLQVTSSKTQKPTAIPHLKVNCAKVYNDCDLDEKNFIMLNSNYFPECTLKNTHYLKCLMGPYSERSGYIVACLTSSGFIELFTFSQDNYELRLIDADLCEIKKKSANKITKEITKFHAFKKAFYEIAFCNFEWSPIAYDDFKILIGVTRSDEVVFFRVQDTEVVQDLSVEVQNVSKNRIKWIDLNAEHYLLVGTSRGNLLRYSISLSDDGVVSKMEKVDEIAGKVRLPISNITVDYHENSTVVLCSKNHSIEIFQFNEKESKLVLSKYVDMTITGVEICNNLQYFISVLNAKVYFLKLKSIGGEIVLDKCSVLESSETQTPSKYGYYGIASSKNNVLVYISCYPQIPFDHLINKQPLRISVNLFTKHDPFEILMANQSFKLTDYSDCVEAVRFIGSSKLEVLVKIEEMNYNIQLGDEFAYYLKLQLLVINAKLIYYQMRSHSIIETLRETRNLILEIIATIHFYKLLNHLLKLKKPSSVQRQIIRASSNALRKYCSSDIVKDPFKTAALYLRPFLMEALLAADALIEKSKLPPEVCDCCEDKIASDALECGLNHKVKRCVVTNLLVALDCGNYCRQCKENITSLETLSLALGNSAETNNFFLCPLCDTKLSFYE